MLYVISVLDGPNLTTYAEFVRNVRQRAKGVSGVRVVALHGELGQTQRTRLRGLVDDSQAYSRLSSYKFFQRKYDPIDEETLSSFAKLFFVREYVESKAGENDLVAVLDPRSHVQISLRDFMGLMRRERVMFAREPRLDNDGHILGEELATTKQGRYEDIVNRARADISVAFAGDYLKLMGEFETYVRSLEPAEIRDSELKKGDQSAPELFRRFCREWRRRDIGVLSRGQVLMAGDLEARCLYYDEDLERYMTVWDTSPHVVHFMNGTIVQVPNLMPEINNAPAPDPIPVYEPELTRATKTGAGEIQVMEPGGHPFPMGNHTVCLRRDTIQMVERWMRRVPSDGRILLLYEEDVAAEEADKLKAKFSQIREVLPIPEETSRGVPLPPFADRLRRQAYKNSVMIPLPIETMPIQFIPGHHNPKYVSYYPLFRGLWRSGARAFAVQSLAGTKHLKLPFLLESFVNKHKGQRCFIAGNGPSLNEIDMSLLKDEVTFGSNRCYLGFEEWGYHFTYWGILDRLQIEGYGTEYEDKLPTDVIKFFPFEYVTLLDFPNACPVQVSFDRTPPLKFSGHPHLLHLGYTVTHMLLQIAVNMGCNPIYLIGCDHRYNLKSVEQNMEKRTGLENARVWAADDAKEATHFTDQYTKGEKKLFIPPRPQKMEEAFRVARNWCDEHGFKVRNATPNTGLTVFELVDYDSLFSKPKALAAPGEPSRVAGESLPQQRVAIFSTMPPDMYSGGRYAALMMAEALANGGHEAHFITNNRPVFLDDLACLPAHDKMHFHVTPDFQTGVPEGPFDFAILVPGVSMKPAFTDLIEGFCEERGAELIFLNFESANWFNSLSPVPRPLKLWDSWKDACRRSRVVMSIAKEGAKWAKEFYTQCPEATLFEYAYPAINTYAADMAPDVPKEKRILVLARFQLAEHKGSEQLKRLLCEAMRSYTLVILVGGGEVPAKTRSDLETHAAKYGIELEFLSRLSDQEKFTEIKRAELMLFPSQFEGYGYPPIEAQYCNTPCVAFDLPVLRETSGDGIVYARHGDWEDFRRRIEETLQSKTSFDHLRDHIRPVASLDTLTQRLNEIMTAVRAASPNEEPVEV